MRRLVGLAFPASAVIPAAMSITTVGLDADDTLWHNETIFRLTHDRFSELLSDVADKDALEQRLAEVEKRNLRLYGYGVKGFTLSMIETAMELTGGEAPSRVIREILAGRNLPVRDPAAVAEDRLALADRLTMEQADLLRVTRLLNRVEIRGGAGSGKTVLAMRQASDLAGGRAGERQRVAVVLRDIEGLANPEIATILGVSVEAVESLAARGRRALRDSLGARRDELGFEDD